MGQSVYIVVREDDLGIASKHLCFTDMAEAYKYALAQANANAMLDRGNYEWKVIHVPVHQDQVDY
jgi:hypothetical protein